MKTVTGNLHPPKTGEREKPKPTLRHHVDEVHKNDEERLRFKMEVLRVSEAVHILEECSQMNRQHEWRQIQLM